MMASLYYLIASVKHGVTWPARQGYKEYAYMMPVIATPLYC